MKAQNMIIGASLLAALAVVLGAFAAHGLKVRLPEGQLNTFEIGVRYQFYHAFALAICGILAILFKTDAFRLAAIFFIIGIVLFSGSLYLLSTRELIGLTTYKWLGPLTPIGGVFFIIGWLTIGYQLFKNNFQI